MELDRHAVVGGVEHLGEGDEVEEDGGGGGGNGDVAPAGTVVEGRGQHRERGEAVEKDRDSEPEERHHKGSRAAKLANLQYLGYGGTMGQEALGMLLGVNATVRSFVSFSYRICRFTPPGSKHRRLAGAAGARSGRV